jgi:hypothetical protein
MTIMMKAQLPTFRHVAIQRRLIVRMTTLNFEFLEFSLVFFFSSFVQKEPLISFICDIRKRSLHLSLSSILAWFNLSYTAQYFFLRLVYFRASVEIVPSAEYFVNPKNPILKYIDFLLPILEPSLNQIRLWASYLSSQSQHSSIPQRFTSKSLPRMDRKEADTANLMDSSYAGFWKTEITGVDEPRLRKAYSIPSSVKLRFDMKDKGAVVHENEHEVCVYEDMFEAGFRFPFPESGEGDAPLSLDSSYSIGPQCLVDLFYLRDSLANGSWRGTQSLGLRVFEDIQINKESQILSSSLTSKVARKLNSFY